MTPFKLPKKRSKYGNKITEVDGRKFHSKAEAEYYLILRDREEKKEIDDLQCQVQFAIHVGNELVCWYVADFVYWENNCRVVVDVKGVRTAEYRLKKKLLKAVWGIDIQEINVKSKWRKKRK